MKVGERLNQELFQIYLAQMQNLQELAKLSICLNHLSNKAHSLLHLLVLDVLSATHLFATTVQSLRQADDCFLVHFLHQVNLRSLQVCSK